MKNRQPETPYDIDVRTELELSIEAAEQAIAAYARGDDLSFRLAVIAAHTRAGLVLHHLAAEL